MTPDKPTRDSRECRAEGFLTFAVGDIHGCFDKLDALLSACSEYARDEPARYVFLGDYIDRGPNSKAVVERLITLQRGSTGSVICLKGNHENMLAHAEFEPLEMLNWLANGGDKTLASYAIDYPQHIPTLHREWLKSLPLFFDDGLRFFVHAGVDPFAAFDDQREDVLLWVRDEFPDNIDTGRLIVHGHTPLWFGRPELRPYRLNIDTGAFAGGPLTAAVFRSSTTAPIAFLTSSGEVEDRPVHQVA
jgi:serine/threonine protein phosphatase 1